LTFGSLFAGIGGFDLGLERAGMVCKWQVEIDPYCRRVLDKHWPDVPKYEDVRNVGSRNLEPVDVICGGFPCQDVSVAGLREGLAGERSGLWFQFHRVLEELAPRWVIVENVPGLLSSNGGRDFAAILSGLAELGYLSAWRVLDAQYFGVAQRRRRVFIVGHLGDGRAAQVLFERESSAWDPAPSREAGQRVAAPLTKCFAKHHGASAGNDGYPHNHVIAPTLTNHCQRYNGGDETLIAAQCHGSNVGPMGELRRGNGHLTGGVPFVAFDRTRATTSGDISAPLRACGAVGEGVNDAKADAQCVAILDGGGGKGKCDLSFDVTPPLSESMTPHSFAATLGVRRLTPTECERLQAFPDGHTSGQSDTQRYKQLGNAVCVANSEWIGRRIVEAT
jgi:DNA (cytosine-5)-methyltransferase 1